MSASTLLSKTPLPRKIAGIYDPQGGGSGVTSITAGAGISASAPSGAVTIANTGVTSIIAGAGISVDTATGDVTVSASGLAPQVFVDSASTGTATSAILVTGSTTGGFSGGGYAQGVLVPGKTYLATCTISADFTAPGTAIPNPGGHWSATLRLTGGGPAKNQDFASTQVVAVGTNGFSESSSSIVFVAPAGYTAADVIITQTTVDPGTIGSYICLQWAVTQLD